MIIVRLQGGLGNQLFQYAAARSASIATKQSVIYFDTFYYSYVRNRHFHLSSFQTHGAVGNVLSFPAFFPITIPFISKTAWRSYHKLRPQSIQLVVEEGAHNYSPHLLATHKDVYLQGFWQNWRYADSIRSLIRKELVLSQPLSDEGKVLEAKISQSNSVGLHVRRGDYVNNPNFPTCSLSYYQHAVKTMQSKLSNPTFFVFSDDSRWVKENLTFIKSMIIVELHSEVEEFWLLSKTKHTIIANSTFSWWGAWLGDNLGKLVIAPSEWNGLRGDSVLSILPRKWEKIQI